MIENIRKYTGLMIVVLVLLFIGLVFLESSAQNLTSGAPAMEVDGRQISKKEFTRLSENTLLIPSKLGDSIIPPDAQKNPLTSLMGGRMAFTSSQLLMGANAALAQDTPDRFLANRLAVQKAGLEYGATPGPDEVEAFIENVLFVDADGNFDAEEYSEFIENRIGSLGIGIRGFNEYIRDLLTAGNLAEIVSGGIEDDPATIEALYRNGKQTIDAQQITLESATFQASQKPTEEEIRTYWEDNQERYNTDERRSVSYVFFEPDWETALAKAEEEKKKAEEVKKAQEEAAKKLKEEARKAEEAAKKANEKNDPPAETPAPNPAEGAEGNAGAQGDPAPPVAPTPKTPSTTPATPPAETPAKAADPIKAPELTELTAKDKLTPKQRQDAINALREQVNTFYVPLVDASGQTFEQVAKEQGLKIVTTELFSKDDAPEIVKERTTNDRRGTIADIIFTIAPESKNDQRITAPYSTGDGQFIGKLEEVEASRPLTFEEAKDKATVHLKEEMARKQLATEAVTIREKIETLIAEGKTFEEAAKELKLTYQKLPGLKIQSRQFTPPAFAAARYTDPGTIAKTQFIPNEESPERALIVYVDKREIVVDEEYKTGLENTVEGHNTAIRLIVFQNWLRERYDENDVKFFEEQR
ncbi:MAG: SurA N-terminal domain-containing protein [Akkermansiaceae bacterium]